MTAGSRVRSVRHRRLFGRTLLVRRMAAAAAVAASVIGVTLPLHTAVAATSGAVTHPANVTDTPTLVVSLANAATIGLGEPVTLDIDWSGVAGLDPTTTSIRVTFSSGTLATASSVDEWMAGGGSSSPAPVLNAQLLSDGSGPVAEVGRTGSVTLPAEVTATLLDRNLVGVRVELVDDAATVVASASLVAATTAATNAAGSSLALVYPLVVPGIETGLISADDLAALTAPGGALDDTLDALIGQPVAVAIDPRIIASIRALGTSAPESAITWLRRLDSLPNVTFPLSYADADLAAQSQAKLDAPLQPIGFRDAIDPANFAPAITTTPAATPTTTPGEPAPAPSDAELIAWPYTRTDIAWPSDDAVAEADLGWFARSGLTKTILSNGNVAPASGRVSASAMVSTSAAVVADGRITAALRKAVAATSHASWRQAMTHLEAELALAGASRDRLTLLATFARSDRPGRLDDTLRELSSVSTLERTTLTEALGTAPMARTLAPAQVAPTLIPSIERMLRLEHDLERFATALTDPTALTAPLRRNLLALISVGASTQPNWAADVIAWIAEGSKTLHSVSVVPGSKVNVVSRESGVPTIVQNLSEFPVTVVIDVAPSNGRLIVEKSVTVTIDPGSRRNVLVPVAAGVGSGDVKLTISLTSPTGVPIGTPVDVDVNAQPDWEGITAAVLAVAVVLLFVVGVVRTIRRRRRLRVAAGEALDSAEANAAAAEPSAHDPAESGDL